MEMQIIIPSIYLAFKLPLNVSSFFLWFKEEHLRQMRYTFIITEAKS